jgi:tetratricopeptide (TPR) repeat protein
LLEVAETLDEQGKVHQALAAYLKLIEHYPDGRDVPVAIEEELAAVISREASAALLRIGKTYQEQGLLHHALSPYLKIVAYYPRSEETKASVDRLMAIAGIFEEKRQFHMALSVYDRMERAARFQCWDGHQATPEGNIL